MAITPSVVEPEETWWTPRDESPVEGRLVEVTCRLDVVRVDRKVSEVCCHDLCSMPPCACVLSTVRRKLSRMRQTEQVLAGQALAEPLVRGYAVTHPGGTVVLPIADGWNQLLFAASGVMTVDSPEGTWVIPPHRALWVPDRARYRVVMRGRVAIRTLYLDSSLPVPIDGWRAVNVSGSAARAHHPRRCPFATRSPPRRSRAVARCPARPVRGTCPTAVDPAATHRRSRPDAGRRDHEQCRGGRLDSRAGSRRRRQPAQARAGLPRRDRIDDRHVAATASTAASVGVARRG